MTFKRYPGEVLASQLSGSKMLQMVPLLEPFAREVNLALWRLSGCPIPPPGLFKARTIRTYARQYSLRCLVETGTYRGNMIATLKRDFDQVYSIELSPELHAVAKHRFAGDSRINLVCGDSGVELPRILQRLTSSALFWLDAHHSGGETAQGTEDTPIMSEIACILRSPQAHVILVDDMRLFGTDPAYPTSEALIGKIAQMAGNRVSTEVREDILRIVPSSSWQQVCGNQCGAAAARL